MGASSRSRCSCFCRSRARVLLRDFAIARGDPWPALWIAAVKGCGGARDVELARIVHAGWSGGGGGVALPLAGSALIDMYARCGSAEDARAVFERIPPPQRDVVSWTALILGYVQCGRYDAALALFLRSRRDSSSCCAPDARLFVAALKACSSLCVRDKELQDQGEGRRVPGDCLESGMAIHADARSSGHDSNVFVANALVDMYARCGSLASARRVFEGMGDCRDVVSWNSLMLGCVDNGEARLALELFARMEASSPWCVPDPRSFTIALKACCGLADDDAGQERSELVDGRMVKLRVLEQCMAIHAQARACASSDAFMANTLVAAYSRCGSLEDARRAFDRAESHDVVSWNALVLGCADNGEPEMALELLSRINAKPTAPTFVAALKACTSMAAAEDGRAVELPGSRKGTVIKVAALKKGVEIHSLIKAAGGCESDVFVTSALLDMYAKCGSMSDARRVFDATVRRRSVVSWNTMILGYADKGEAETALELLAQMVEEQCRPNAVTLATALKATDGSSLKAVKAIHALASWMGSDEEDVVFTSLIDSYGKCGSVDRAELVFGSVSSRNSVTWNALLAGYSKLGDVSRAVELFGKMVEEGVGLSSATFVSLLTTCSHAGLVATGKRYFELMEPAFGVSRGIEHYHCLVDILSRANKLDQAMAVVASMPFAATPVTWTTILAACAKWNNILIGKVAFERLRQLDRNDSAACSLMSNLCGSLRMWAENEYSCIFYLQNSREEDCLGSGSNV